MSIVFSLLLFAPWTFIDLWFSFIAAVEYVLPHYWSVWMFAHDMDRAELTQWQTLAPIINPWKKLITAAHGAWKQEEIERWLMGRTEGRGHVRVCEWLHELQEFCLLCIMWGCVDLTVQRNLLWLVEGQIYTGLFYHSLLYSLKMVRLSV